MNIFIGFIGDRAAMAPIDHKRFIRASEFANVPLKGTSAVSLVNACPLMLAFVFLVPDCLLASSGEPKPMGLATSPVGFGALVLFVLAYALVMTEEFTHLRKSKPVILAAGIIWLMISLASPPEQAEFVEEVLRHNILEYAELMLFLLLR